MRDQKTPTSKIPKIPLTDWTYNCSRTISTVRILKSRQVFMGYEYSTVITVQLVSYWFRLLRFVGNKYSPSHLTLVGNIKPIKGKTKKARRKIQPHSRRICMSIQSGRGIDPQFLDDWLEAWTGRSRKSKGLTKYFPESMEKYKVILPEPPESFLVLLSLYGLSRTPRRVACAS